MTFHVVTLFPESFDSYISSSIIGRAVCDKKIKIKFYNPRDFSDNKFKHIDQKPYSGGPGMVIQALPVVKAIEKAIKGITPPSPSYIKRGKKERKELLSKIHNPKTLIVWLSPNGKQFNTDYAKKISKKYNDIILISGRYEGIDARVFEIIKKLKEVKIEKLSVGPYILTGGELPAMVMIDCISRQIEGVLGNFDSLEESRTASSDVYTRPEILIYKGKKYRVPKVLLSGNHKKIEEWRKGK